MGSGVVRSRFSSSFRLFCPFVAIGVMPGRWPTAHSGCAGRRLVLLFLLLVLRWSKPLWSGGRFCTAPSNKPVSDVHRCFEVEVVDDAKMLPAGRGGEEKQIGGIQFLPRSMARGLAIPLLAYRGGEGKGWHSAWTPSSTTHRSWPCRHRHLQLLRSQSLLAGRGGEGEEDEDREVAVVRWWRRGLLGSAPSAAVSKQRRWCAGAICGHKDGPAALKLVGLSFFFPLKWGIFLDLGVAANAAALPSGFVPGGCGGGHARRSAFDGGELVLDRVLRSYFGCCVKMLRTHVRIFLFWGPPCKCTPSS